MRLPLTTKTELDALSGMTGLSLSQLVDAVVRKYVADLPDGERRLFEAIRSRRTGVAGTEADDARSR